MQFHLVNKIQNVYRVATINNEHVVREDQSLPAGQNELDQTYIFPNIPSTILMVCLLVLLKLNDFHFTFNFHTSLLYFIDFLIICVLEAGS